MGARLPPFLFASVTAGCSWLTLVAKSPARALRVLASANAVQTGQALGMMEGCQLWASLLDTKQVALVPSFTFLTCQVGCEALARLDCGGLCGKNLGLDGKQPWE